MPSPVAHLAAAYAVYEVARHYEPATSFRLPGPVPALLAVTALFSMLPDADVVVGLLAGDMERFHNNASHSLVVGFCIALLFGAVMQRLKWGSMRFWFPVALVCYSLHVVMDSATLGRGVMAFWPLTDVRFVTPIPLFYGVRWSGGLFDMRHLWTIATELLFAVCIVVLLPRRPRRAKVEA